MHILIEPSDYVLKNAGDMAMQEVAVTRLARFWPDAEILVLTNTPAELPRYAANVRPVDAGGRRAWLAQPSQRDRDPAGRPTAPVDLAGRLRSMLAPWVWADRRQRRASQPRARDFVRLVSSASLVAVSGMGGITDAFPDYATGVLETLDLAARAGVPTAMLGQGMGPLREGRLRNLARRTLPRVDLIALREARTGHPLLTELGVAPERILVTGDDAIEMAYRPDPIALGPALGINLRRASYAEVDAAVVDAVRPALAACARHHGARLVPVPISHVPGEEDALTIADLLGDAAASRPDPEPVALPGLLEHIRGCRVVVTGSYHAGVFALASGIPVVALARSAYYIDKFLGLADQFGGGCDLVRLDAPDPAARLVAAVDGAWHAADRLRPRLLDAAARQIELGRAAYRRVHALVHRDAGRTP